MPSKSSIGRFFRSLKFRLILLLIITAICPGAILCKGMLNSYTDRAISLRESEVLSQAQILANQIGTSELMENGSTRIDDTIQAQIDMLTNIYDGRVMIVNQDFKIIADTYNLSYGQFIISEEVIKSFSGSTYCNYESEYQYIEMTVPISDPDNPKADPLGVLLVSVSTDNIRLNRTYLARMVNIWAIILITVAILIGITVVNLILKPLHRLGKEVNSMQEGYGKDKLDVYTCTETAELCDDINAMTNRMKVMDESRQEFVANVSHELKTPMTSIKVLADTINMMPDAPLEMYQEFMGDITSEIDRENQIITDLLSMVKMDKSAADLNIAQISINDMLEQIMKRMQPIADKQKVELVLESFRPVRAEIDEVKLTLAFTNLIENAVKYNKNDGTGWVHVSLNSDHQYFYLKVEDSGMGIPEDSLEHIFERFYRVNKSHSREIGGTGLGLAITKTAVQLHKGQIKVYSKLGEGTTFDVRIPLTYIAQEN